MAKGQKSKIVIQNKILELFPEAFIYGKEIRIPLKENGEDIQIKVTLTCAKDNVIQGGENILPGAELKNKNESYHFGSTLQTTVTENKERAESR